MDIPHEHEIAILNEILTRQEMMMSVMVWRLGGQVSMTYEEMIHVTKSYEVERQSKVNERKGEFSFTLKVR